ncbi:MAG TPA: hypothetical protein VMY05_02825 [Acidobacteriota bacterium]|nr:hypothetical protein [Acidobacteriota bacterium]
MKPIRFLGRILRLFARGEFSLGLHTLAGELPAWLFRFNRAWIVRTVSFELSEKYSPEVKVHTATLSDIDDIDRIGNLTRDQVESLLKAGAVCFLSSLGDDPPVAVVWGAWGRCYVRGMGFDYDFGPAGYYMFGAYTVPEARGKGIYMPALAASIRYAHDHQATAFFGLLEFTNNHSFSIHTKLGLSPFLYITYAKILFVRFSHVKNLAEGKSSLKVSIRVPRNNVTIV